MTCRRCSVAVTSFSFVSLAWAASAFAHEVHIIASPEGETVTGRVYFAGDVPAADVSVEITDEDGWPVAEVVTDEKGRFTFAPQKAAPHTFTVQTLDGHRASITVDLTGRMASGPGLGEQEGAESGEIEALREEITTLREEMDAREHQVRARDVIAGIGYIIGVMGLIAFWKARRPE